MAKTTEHREARPKFWKIRRIIAFWRKPITAISRRFARTHLTVYAAQASYYVIFSSIPFLMLLCMTAKGAFPTEFDRILSRAREALPPLFGELPDLFWETLLSVSAPALSIAILSLLWAASKGVKAISMGLCSVYGVKPPKNFLLRRLFSIGHTVVLILAILFALLLLVFGSQIVSLLEGIFKPAAALLHLILRLRGLIAILAFSLVFTLMYKFMAARSWHFRRLLPGAIFAGGGWILFSQAFSLYLQYFSRYTSLYGALGILMVCMMWVHGCMLLLLLGAELNVFLDTSRVI